jgi:hypothetical protein
VYLIRLPSGEERSYDTIGDLATAIQKGEISRNVEIYHRRSERWLPLDEHPYFGFAAGERDTAPPPPMPPMEETPPASLIAEEDRKTGAADIAPLRPEGAKSAPPPPAAKPPVVEPVTPVEAGASRQARHPGEGRDEPREYIAPTPLSVPRPRERWPEPEPRHEPKTAATNRPAPEQLEIRAPRGRRTGLVIGIIVVLGSAIGILIGLKLKHAESPAGAVAGTPQFQPAPAPSSLLADSAPADTAPAASATVQPARVDPTAPATVEQLEARRRGAFLAVQAQLGRDLAAVDFNSILGVLALSTPDGARAARRTVASALNVIGQFHRREVMTDRAYEDTASYQTTRAGWTRDQIARWAARPTLKEPYQSADLAESLLADADSLLGILTAGNQWTVSGDSLHFGNPNLTAAWRAQRARLVQRAGPPVTDTIARPALAYVRGALSTESLPGAGP